MNPSTFFSWQPYLGGCLLLDCLIYFTMLVSDLVITRSTLLRRDRLYQLSASVIQAWSAIHKTEWGNCISSVLWKGCWADTEKTQTQVHSQLQMVTKYPWAHPFFSTHLPHISVVFRKNKNEKLEYQSKKLNAYGVYFVFPRMGKGVYEMFGSCTKITLPANIACNIIMAQYQETPFWNWTFFCGHVIKRGHVAEGLCETLWAQVTNGHKSSWHFISKCYLIYSRMRPAIW